MSAENPTLLRLEGVGRTYGGPEGVAALGRIDLSIRAGEFVAIVGTSGSGKSTLLNLLGLLDTPSSGTYRIDGVLAEELAERERDQLRARTFGFVFQDSHMLLGETAGSNAAMGLVINGVDPALRTETVARALATVRMVDKAQHLARNLSGGERQRVAIARATATSPRILLADEPTGALDTANSARVIKTFRDLNAAGVTVILITHDPGIAAAADRIISLSDGHITSDRSSEPAPPAAAVAAAAAAAAVKPLPELPAQTQSLRSKIIERCLTAVSNHTVHVARAVLLLIAFTVGAAGLVTATGLSQSAAGQISTRFDSAGLDRFFVVPKSDSVGIRAELGVPEDTTSMAVASIGAERLTRLEGVTTVGLFAESGFDGVVTLLNPATVSEQPGFRPLAFVADETYLRQQGVRLMGADAGEAAAGGALRFFAGESDAPRVILGASLAEQLGVTVSQPGAQLWIGGMPVAVLGIIGDFGEEPRFASALVATPGPAGAVTTPDLTFLVTTLPGDPGQLAALAGEALTPGKPGLYTAETVADLNALQRGVAADLLALVNLVAWVLLVLASLSAATAAYLSVHARATEIALRRAVGESRRSVWGQFVLEGLSVGLLGGVLGSALGVVLTVLIAAVQGWQATFSLSIVALGVGTGALTGVVASLHPAAVAARQDPALAVRGV